MTISSIKINLSIIIWLIMGLLFLMAVLYLGLSRPLAALGALLVLVFVLVLSYRLEWGIYLMAFFLPVIHWDFFYKSLQVPFIDLLGLLVLAAFLLNRFTLAFTAGPNKNKTAVKWPFLFGFILFYGASVISSLLTPEYLTSLWYGVRWLLLFYLLYVVLPVNIIKNEKILKKTIIAFVLSAVAVAIMGVVSLYGQDWRAGFVRVVPISIAGIYPIGANQNLIVEVLLPGIFYLLALKLWSTNARTRRLINISLIFLAVVLIGTFSRGGWLSLGVTVTLYAFIQYRQRIKKFILPILLTLILCTPIFIYMYKLQTDFAIGIGSNKSRIISTQVAISAFLQKPWLGQGPGEYMNLTENNIRFMAKFGSSLESHGIIQKIIAENGGLGIASFILFLGLISITLKQGLNSLPAKKEIVLLIIMGALSIFIFELFNTSYYKGKLWLPIALALAAVYLFKDKQGEKENYEQ